MASKGDIAIGKSNHQLKNGPDNLKNPEDKFIDSEIAIGYNTGMYTIKMMDRGV